MKIYLNKVNESWIIDRVRKDWYYHKKQISTRFIRNSDIIWIISPWVWKTIPKKYMINKKILCSYYHFDFENFDSSDFDELDQYVDQYHVISKKTKEDLSKLTNKKITSIPFWINQEIFFNIQDKKNLRNKYGFQDNDFLVGSFQRDTESSDLQSPKLIKGPDIFIELIDELYMNKPNLKVVLSGNNRQYVISKLENLDIPYKYFEMINLNKLNELYNLLDLYLVTSRIEGGPQAILESSITKTPILSTDVGVASEILHKDSIYDINNFSTAKPNVDYAFQSSRDFTIPIGLNKFDKIFKDIHES